MTPTLRSQPGGRRMPWSRRRLCRLSCRGTGQALARRVAISFLCRHSHGSASPRPKQRRRACLPPSALPRQVCPRSGLPLPDLPVQVRASQIRAVQLRVDRLSVAEVCADQFRFGRITLRKSAPNTENARQILSFSWPCSCRRIPDDLSGKPPLTRRCGSRYPSAFDNRSHLIPTKVSTGAPCPTAEQCTTAGAGSIRAARDALKKHAKGRPGI